MLPPIPDDVSARIRIMISRNTIKGSNTRVTRSSPLLNDWAQMLTSRMTNSVCHSVMRSLSVVKS